MMRSALACRKHDGTRVLNARFIRTQGRRPKWLVYCKTCIVSCPVHSFTVFKKKFSLQKVVQAKQVLAEQLFLNSNPSKLQEIVSRSLCYSERAS